ncbi:MAG: hypothetical protein U0V03_08835 [Bacteroidia bacterium]
MVKLTLNFIVILIITSSCSSKFSIQKRKYNNGIYFAHTKTHKNSLTKLKTTKPIASELNSDKIYLKPVSLLSKEEELVDNKLANDLNFENKSTLIENKNFKSEEKLQKNKNVVASLKNSLPLINYKFKTINQKKLIGKKNDFLNFIGNLYIGYLIVSLIIAVAFLIYFYLQIYPLIKVIAIVAVVVLIIVALAGLGSLVRRGG